MSSAPKLETPEALRPLRVGFYVFFPGGGIGRYTHMLMNAMARRAETDVEVLCSPDFDWRGTGNYAEWPGLKPVWTPAPIKRRLWFLRGQLMNPLLAIRHAARSGLDVLHFASVNHLTFPLWRWALDRTSLRMAVSVHDVRRGKAMISRAWEERQLKAVYRRADALFVHSQHQADELRAYANVPASRIHVVPHGPYPHGTASMRTAQARAEWNLPAEGQIALFFGQIRDEKNLDALLAAWKRSATTCHLLIAGKPWPGHRDADFYRARIEALGLSEQVTFLNRYIDDEEVPSLFTAADWVALPYQSGFTSQSGVLNVAAHYERPLLVSDAPVLKETVQACDIGVACAGDQAEALAQGISKISARVRENYHHAFAEYRERYSWKANASKTLQVYSSLMS